MFLRLLFESFRRQKRRKSVALLAIALGMSIATAMIAVGNDIGDKINQELRSLGANLVVTPIEDTLDVNIGGVNLKPASEGAFINEQDLIKIKGIFWGHNIKGYAPFLSDRQQIQTRNGEVDASKIRFYIGYSGWAGGQLDGELKEKSWLTADANRKLVFHQQTTEIWKDAIRLLGGDYEMMINFPIDPQLN